MLWILLLLPCRGTIALTAIHSKTTSVVKQKQAQTQIAAACSSSTNKKIAVIGTGAVGGYYGSRLWQVGHTVHFFMRDPHYSAAQTNGLVVNSVEGDIHIAPHVLKSFDSTCQMDKDYDWVLISLKSTSLEAIPKLLEPVTSPQTRVLVIMNGMIEDALIKGIQEHFPDESGTLPLQCCKTLYGGMALICSNRHQPAVIDHSYFGLLSAGVASSNDTPENDRAAFQDLFSRTIVNVSFEESLLRGRWKKMLWNLPFNGLSVAMGGITVDQIVQDAGLRSLAYTIMDETIQAANMEMKERQLEGDLGILERAAMMKLSDDMGPYKPSTMLDFSNRRPMEVRYLFREPLDRAKRMGVKVPHLETIVMQIEAYQRKYNLF